MDLPSLSRQLASVYVPPLQTASSSAYILRSVKAEAQGGPRKEWIDVQASLKGLARSSRVRVQDDLADALEEVLNSLERHGRTRRPDEEGESNISASNLPQHIQLLLNLSEHPTLATHDFAHGFLHRQANPAPDPDKLLFQEIMREPFSGTHWTDNPDEEDLEGWSDSDENDDVEESSASEEEIVTPSSVRLRQMRLDRERLEKDRHHEEVLHQISLAKEELRRHRENSYWVTGGSPVSDLPDGLYGWRDLSTGAQVMSLEERIRPGTRPKHKFISAHSLHRELLFALSGRPGVCLTFNDEGMCQIVPDHPQVAHLTSAALRDLLLVLAGWCSQASMLRDFIKTTCMTPADQAALSSAKLSRTSQAFADACREAMAPFETWLSESETRLLRGVASSSTAMSAISTPLSLRVTMETDFAPLLEILCSYLSYSSSPVLLLDSIYLSLVALAPTTALSKPLMCLFVHTAQPLWYLLGQWLNQGMPVPLSMIDDSDSHDDEMQDDPVLDPEFFIVHDRDVSWTDEDFWEAGFVSSAEGWPQWLGDTEDMVLEAGKARGLLRAFGSATVDFEPWKALSEMVDVGSNVSAMIPFIESAISPTCSLTTFQLRRVLDEECGLMEHLDAIEGVLYMQGYAVMNDWSAWLYRRMRSRNRWADFHQLTTGLRDIVAQQKADWLNSSAIRVRSKRTTGSTNLRILGEVQVTYEVPFPLSQLFTPTSIELRSEICSFLLQLDHSSRTLIATKVLDPEFLADSHATPDVRRMWQVRHRLLSIISAIRAWLMDQVIIVLTQQLRDALARETSLKEMIALELDHARRIHDLAYLHPKHSHLRENLLDILEMSWTLSDAYLSFMAGTTPHARRSHTAVPGARRKRRDRLSSDDETSEEDEADDAHEVGQATVGSSTDFEDQIKMIEDELGDRLAILVRDIDELANNGDRNRYINGILLSVLRTIHR